MSEASNGQEASGNKQVLRALFDELDVMGVTEFCVCAGARNASIIEALTTRVASGQFPELRIYHFFDERSAAFFALGRVMESRRPVAVLTTSGTAAAELLPAMVEAFYQNLPLVAVTADRPSRFRGSGAPQVIEQRGIFGTYTSSVEMECGSLSERNGTAMGLHGPVHFNVCLEEGLGASNAFVDRRKLPHDQVVTACSEKDRASFNDFLQGEGALLVTVAGLHPEDVLLASEFLECVGAPIIAEATSNLGSRKELRPLLLRGGEKCFHQVQPQRVLRIGAVPSWRWWRDLEVREEVSVLNVSRAAFRGLGREVNVTTLPWEALSISDFGFWKSDSAKPADGGDLDHILKNYPNAEPSWMRHLSRIIGAGATVFLGNSLPIREWNLAAEAPKLGTAFYANRGANGIDGLVSTWLGVAAEAEESWLIVGDLSALYDLGAPWILPQLKKGKRRIVVINNGGGKIFSQVGWLKHVPAETKRVMENPHAISLEPWARMWGVDYRLLTDPGEISDDDSPCSIWEVRPDAAQSDSFWSAWKCS